MAKKPKVKSFEEYDFEGLCLYGGIDTIVTLGLLKKLYPRMIEQPTYISTKDGSKVKRNAPSVLEETMRIKNPALEFILDMQIAGFKYDVEKNRQLTERCGREIAELNQSIFTAIKKNPNTFNLDSDVDLVGYLYSELGLEVPSYTASGAPSTDGDALKALHKKYGFQWLLDLGKRNDLSSIYNSFLHGYVERFVKRDGRIHPQYNLHGTSSHRISSDSPNLLNIPSPMHGYNLRECYTVENGYVFIAFDFSSCEVKVLGALSKDPLLLQAIAEGKDFHSFTACAIHGLKYEDFVKVLDDDSHPEYKKYKKMRQGAKAVTWYRVSV